MLGQGGIQSPRPRWDGQCWSASRRSGVRTTRCMVARASTPDCRPRATGRAQAGGAADAAGRQRTGWSPPLGQGHDARRGDPSGARLGGAGHQRHRADQLGGRHHLRADLGGVSVPGGGAGWSRRVVGWSLAGHLRRHPELVQEALTWPSGSRPWSASCWSGADFAVAARRAWPCSSSLRVLQPAPASLGAGLPLAGRNVRQKWQHQRCLAGNLGIGSPPGPAVHRSASESASERPPEPLPNPGVYPRVPPETPGNPRKPPETLKVPVNAVSQSLWLRAIRRPRRPPGPAIKDTPARSSCCCSEPITSACRRAAGRVRGRSGSISISAAVRLSRELPGPPEPSDPAAPPAPLRNGAQ